MAKEPKEPPSIAPPGTLSSSTPPPPSVPPVKKPLAASTVAVLPKHTDPSSESVDSEEEDEDEGSESEEVSLDEESSEDSRAADADVNPNPPSHLQDSRNANGKQASNSYPSSESSSEFGEEAGEEVNSSSESEQQQPLFPAHAAGNTTGIKSAAIIPGSDSASEDESPNSSDSNMIVPPPRSSSRNIAGPSLKPLSSKPMDSPAQLADQNTLFGKRSATPSDQIAEKKRKTVDAFRTEGGQEKKENSRKYWSKAEELTLLQCILDYKENHHAIPCTEMQLEHLLKALNDSLPIPVTLNQLILKIRRLRLKYINTTKSVKGAKNPNIFNAHDASVFDKSRNIWDSGNHDVVAFDKMKKIGVSCKDDSCFIEQKTKGKKRFAEEYPFLYWHVKSEHPNNALVHGDYVPIAEAKNLEGSCRKLEIAEIQLHMQKIKLLPSALKLIEDVLAK